jgi:hypothetical protein
MSTHRHRPDPTELTPRLPFPVHEGWYESCWYRDRREPGPLRRTGAALGARILREFRVPPARRVGLRTD